MRIALDTNRYVDLYRGVAEVVAVMERADEIVVPFIALGELRTGFAQGNRREKNERALVASLRGPGCQWGSRMKVRPSSMRT